MCFSASASFGVSAILLAGGIGSIKNVKTTAQIAFAVIPVLFAIQQFTEGIIWLSLTNMNVSGWNNSATYTFLFIAQVLWPVWVPFSIFLMESNYIRKRVLLGLTGIGCITSFYMAYTLITSDFHSSISNHHIQYNQNFSTIVINLGSVFYFLPTVLPAFISSLKKMIYIGMLLLSSYIISKLYYPENVVSVWCYFAAAISIAVFLIIASSRQTEKLPELTE